MLPVAAHLVRNGRRRYLKIQASWPWAQAITARGGHRIHALQQAPDQRQAIPAIQELDPGPVELMATQPQLYPAAKSGSITRPARRPAPAINPVKDQS